jgi:hypothetical protein
VVGFDVEDRRGARGDRRRQLFGRAFVGVARFHQLTACVQKSMLNVAQAAEVARQHHLPLIVDAAAEEDLQCAG